ncbi:MAG: IPT/TIG domain-containing protein [Candidatus Kapaibacteriota bacterium]
MFKRFLSVTSLYAALALLLFSCRQPIDLDIDRSVVATNLPEITDFSPKVGWLGDRITITGKNFTNVKNVMLDTLILDSVVVESRTRISAKIPALSVATAPFSIPLARRALSVTTKLGTASAQTQDFIFARGAVIGRIMAENQPLDSVIFNIVNQTNNWSSIGILEGHPFGRGWYSFRYSSLSSGAVNTTEDIVIQPFKSGYSFSPPTRNIRTLEWNKALAEQDFEAKRVPSDQLPLVSSITPNFGKSYSGAAETGTDIVLQGRGFATVRKIVVVGVGYTEATIFRVENDSRITVRIPRFDRFQALSGRTYTNCQIYLLRDDGSYLAPQRISITYI